MTERYVINNNMIEDTLSDDYYHFNDWRDFEGLCKLANSLYDENKPLQDEMQRRFKSFQKELNEVVEANNNLIRENDELKKEVELLRNGLNAYDETLPLFLTCREISSFNSELFDFKMQEMEFYKKHPNRAKIVIDGVKYD